jgi:hypothetical protein
MKALTRTEFVKYALSTAAVAVFAPACGDDDDDSGTSGANCASGSVTTEIGTNHGHTLTVPLADVMSGAPKSYTLTTGNFHTHVVEVTAANFSALKGSGSVSGLVTVVDATQHMHTVLLTCTG